MSAPEVRRCEVFDAPPGWPELQVLAVVHPRSADLASGREAARQRVRALLLHHAGPGIAAPFLAEARAARGARSASISHAQSHSLLAWCRQGYIGIDSVDPQGLIDMALPELATTAALYLGPATSAAIGATTEASQARRRFADAWARHEASLKCLGLALDEWSPALHARMAGCSTAVVSPPSQDGAAPAPWVIRIAWRSRSSPWEK